MEKKSTEPADTVSTLEKLNLKVKLLNLIIQAKNEYDSYNFEAAKKTLKEAYLVEKENPIVLRGLGCIYHSEKKFDIAVEYYKHALKHSKNKEIEYTLIATAYYEQDKLDDAIFYFNLAIDKNDDYTQAYEGRNQALLENHVKLLELQDILAQHKF